MTVTSVEFFFILGSLIFVESSFGSPFWRRDVYDNNLDGGMGNLAHMEGRIFGNPSNASGARVAKWSQSQGGNPEELGEYAEGDILFPASFGRNGLRADITRWPGGVIPYMISPFFSKLNV